MKKLLAAIALSCFLAVTSCQKDPVIITDNQAPPDSTITDITIEKYVNKVYISLLGREADDSEFPAAVQQLRNSNFAKSARESFVTQVQALPGYNTKLFDVARQELLNNIPIQELQERRSVYEFILTNQSLSYLWPQIHYELPRLDSLLAVPAALNRGISMIELHQRCVNNYQYDEINMGSLNFCVSMFQNFLFRYPTEAELNAGVQMINGFPSVFFLETGNNKEDFINIFFSNNNYYEGQVRYLFGKLLYRQPNTNEMATYTAFYKVSGSYRELQKKILVSDEFAGL